MKFNDSINILGTIYASNISMLKKNIRQFSAPTGTKTVWYFFIKNSFQHISITHNAITINIYSIFSSQSMAYGYIKEVRSKKYMIHHENKTHFLKRMSLYRLIKKHQNLYTVLGYYIEQFSATWSLASEHNNIYTWHLGYWWDGITYIYIYL